MEQETISLSWVEEMLYELISSRGTYKKCEYSKESDDQDASDN